MDLLNALTISDKCESNANVSTEELRYLQSIMPRINDDPNRSVSENIIRDSVANTSKMLEHENKQEDYLNKASELS